jgi:hypothetical protein
MNRAAVKQFTEDWGKGFKVNVKKHKEDKYEVNFGPYKFYVSHPYHARMAIYALLKSEQELMNQGYVEKMIDWKDEDWAIWDPYRVFDVGRFTVYRDDSILDNAVDVVVEDAIIDLEVRKIYVPYSKENKFKVYVKGFVRCYVPLE